MLFRKLKLKITFAVIYENNNCYTSCFVIVEHDLNEHQTYHLINDRKVPTDVKQLIERKALNELRANDIYAVNLINMRVIRKELTAL